MHLISFKLSSRNKKLELLELKDHDVIIVEDLGAPCGLYCGWCPSLSLDVKSSHVRAADLGRNTPLEIVQKVRV